MSHKTYPAAAPSEPRRTLQADFTAHTLRHAITAKRRVTTKQHIKAFLKEPFTMKSFAFLRTAPGAALAIVILAGTSAGAYAMTNWFSGNVTVKQSDSVLSVDLSDCKGNLPPGIEAHTDMRNVQFKIVGNPHISSEQLQRQFLAECEYNAVVDFYRSRTESKSYAFYPGTVILLGAAGQVTVTYTWGGAMHEKTFTLPQQASYYDQGKKIDVVNLAAGDTIILAVNTPGVVEGQDPLASVNEVQSIFKTQYDTAEAPGATKRAFYEESNIMPLNMYNQLSR